MKLKKFWLIKQKNDDDEMKKNRLEALNNGNFEPPENSFIVLKVFNENFNTTKVTKINTSETFEVILTKAKLLIEKENSDFYISLSGTNQQPLNSNSLKEAIIKVFKGELKCIALTSM